MTTTARTAELVISAKRVQFDSALRAITNPEMQDHVLRLGLPYVFSEAFRWLSDTKTPGSTGVMYVNDAQWAQVQDAMNFLLAELKKPPASIAYLTWYHVARRMPEGYRTGPAQTPVITTGGTVGTSTPDVGAAQTGAANLDQAVQDAGTPVVPQTEGGVIVLPTPPADAGSSGGNAITAPAGTSWWATAPDTHKAGAVAAGVVGALLLFKLAK